MRNGRLHSMHGRCLAWRISMVLALAGCLQAYFVPVAAADESISISPRGLQTTTPFSGGEVQSWSKTSVALGVALGTAIVGLFIARRFMPRLAQDARLGQIQILSQTPLGARGVVYVLRCGPRVLILGATASHISTLSEIADPDEVDEFKRTGYPSVLPRAQSGARGGSPAAELKGQLHGMLNKIESWSDQS